MLIYIVASEPKNDKAIAALVTTDYSVIPGKPHIADGTFFLKREDAESTARTLNHRYGCEVVRVYEANLEFNEVPV